MQRKVVKVFAFALIAAILWRAVKKLAAPFCDDYYPMGKR